MQMPCQERLYLRVLLRHILGLLGLLDLLDLLGPAGPFDGLEARCTVRLLDALRFLGSPRLFLTLTSPNNPSLETRNLFGNHREEQRIRRLEIRNLYDDREERIRRRFVHAHAHAQRRGRDRSTKKSSKMLRHRCNHCRPDSNNRSRQH